MLKNLIGKIVKWHKEHEPKDYYDPYTGIVMLAKKKEKKTE